MVYGLAMLAYAFDFAFTRRQVVASAAAPATDKEKVNTAALVSVGAGTDLPDGNFGADPTDPSQLADLSDQASGLGGGSGGPIGQTRWPAGTWLRLAFALTC